MKITIETENPSYEIVIKAHELGNPEEERKALAESIRETLVADLSQRPSVRTQQ